MRTTELLPPPAPTGLGLVGITNLNTINRNGETNFGTNGTDYIIFEWNRIHDGNYDDRNFELPPGIVDEMTASELWQTITTYILRAHEGNTRNGLEHNTAYYARVKTRLTVTNGTPVQVNYQYVFQISDNPDFFNADEIVVPPGDFDGAGQSIVRESAWHGPITVHTSQTSDEYDGDVDPATFPLPDHDFEWIYDPFTQTLTYRFRSDGVDQFGNRDNHVDQRFINWLIQSQIYNFTVDFAHHPFENIQIGRRAVEIPYSVYAAMADRFVDLTFIMGGTTYAFPAQFLQMPEVWAMTGFGYGAFIQIMSEENPADAPRINGEFQTYAASPNKLTIRVTAGTHSLNLPRTILPFSVIQRAQHRHLLFSGNVAGFQSTFTTQAWNQGNFTVNTANETITQTTSEVGTYSAIVSASPVILGNDPQVHNIVERVSQFISFEDMLYFDPNAAVSSSQLNKLTAAIAAGRSSVNLNAPLTSDENNSLVRSGLMTVFNDVISRQEAISTLVRLYELKTRTQIRQYTPLLQSGHWDIAGADEHFIPDLLKAFDLGLYEAPPLAVRPHEPMTLRELMRMIDLIIQMAGLQ
jgi:hypothetical protein